MYSTRGAQASAVIYSLVETAKANNLNVYEYFEYLLTELSAHADDPDPSFVEELLPWTEKTQNKCRSRKKIDSLFKVLKFGTASKTAVFLFLFHARVLMFVFTNEVTTECDRGVGIIGCRFITADAKFFIQIPVVPPTVHYLCLSAFLL